MTAAYSDGFHVKSEIEKTAERPGGEEWDEARERIMLYLRALNIPAGKGLEIALEALNIAQKETSGEDKPNPVSSAMKALKRTLACHDLFSAEGLTYGRRLRNSGVNDADLTEKPRSMPPINRGSMKPEKFE
jgi:hypothetical protein